jgi:hypothetical protein
LGMTGLKITMLWRAKTRRADGWDGLVCWKVWPGLSGCRSPGFGSGMAPRVPKSDAADAHALAGMVRTDRRQLRPVAGDSEQAQAVKVVARALWDRQRHMLRLPTIGRPGCARIVGQGTGSGSGSALVAGADHRCVETGPPLRGGGQGCRDPA